MKGSKIKTRTFKYLIECPKCKGSGQIIDKGLAAGTFGMSLICGLFNQESSHKECPRCDGSGYIEKEQVVYENED